MSSREVRGSDFSHLSPLFRHHEPLLLRIVDTLRIDEAVLRIAVLSRVSVLLIQLVAVLLVIARRVRPYYADVGGRQSISAVVPRGIVHQRVQPREG